MLTDSDIEHDAGMTSSTASQPKYDFDYIYPFTKSLTQEQKRPICTLTPSDPVEDARRSLQPNAPCPDQRLCANPTPLALIGFLMSLTPLSNVLLEWRGSGELGAAGIGVFYSFGGLLMLLGSLLEYLTGNTFPCIVFGTYGAFWLAQAIDMTPSFNAAGAYGANGSSTPMYSATSGFFTLYMGLTTLVFVVASLRTNLCLFLILLCLEIHFTALTACYWSLAGGKDGLALHMQHAAGASAFAGCLVGWYLFVAQIFDAVDFPLKLPVGKFRGVFKRGKMLEEKGKRR